MVTLAAIARELGVAAASDTEILGVTADSHRVRPGTLFVALPGARTHGARFAPAAIAAGAAAVVTDEAGRGLITSAEVPVLVVRDVGQQVGRIAAIVHGEPAASLRLFGITGTNGKTTTSYMLDDILTRAGRSSGIIGGVELRVGGTTAPAELTTPMPADVQRMLADHVTGGGTDLVMEVTSHAIVQHRVDPLRFTVAGFTNLTQDHLDFHDSLGDYFEAKATLFTHDRCEAAVILVDDEWGRLLYRRAVTSLDRVFAIAVSASLPAGAEGWQVEIMGEGAFAMQDSHGHRARYELGLPGDFNIANAALAVGMALAGGVAEEDIPAVIAPVVPGRMELISEADPRVVVDFAHNAAALTLAMSALRPTTRGKLIVLTGSAGDRDREKRFEMGRIVAEHADAVIITDDDPHGEPPALIRRALLEGAAQGTAHTTEIADRTSAIRAAILEADDADTVLIAGRGHETVQEVGDRRLELDDRAIARSVLEERRARQPGTQ